MKEVTRYKNEMNTLSIGKWTAEEMNFLFAILTQVRDEGCKTLTFDTYDLREFVNFDPKKPDRWNKTMKSVVSKISQLVYLYEDEEVFKALTLFREFSIDLKKQIVTVKVSEDMEYILNKLNIDTGNWTQFEFFEFSMLKSVYSKSVFRFLKQYRKTGLWKVSLEDFRNLLSIPTSYKPSHIDSRVLNPIMNELPPIFKGLKVHKVKSRRRGNQLLGYEFTFQREQTGDYITDKYNKKEKSKVGQLPEWTKKEQKIEVSDEDMAQLNKRFDDIKKTEISNNKSI